MRPGRPRRGHRICDVKRTLSDFFNIGGSLCAGRCVWTTSGSVAEGHLLEDVHGAAESFWYDFPVGVGARSGVLVAEPPVGGTVFWQVAAMSASVPVADAGRLGLCRPDFQAVAEEVVRR